MFFSVLVATFLPTKAFGLVRAWSFTTSPLKSAVALPVVPLPTDTALMGRPLVCATSTEIELLKPNWYCPAATAGRIAAPPWAVCSVRSIPCSVKNPFSLPR